jgi:hypothetical protein
MKIKIGVMASAETEVAARLRPLLEDLSAEIAERDLLLLTGATTGVPDAVSREARRRGCFTIGISPAHNAREHSAAYGLPADGCDALIFTGFGLKGRNVVLVRSSDIVIVIAGGMGTLNEFTIAVDEGKVVGVLGGTGGIADEIEALLPHVRRPENVIIEGLPARLLDWCLQRHQQLKAVS